MTTFPRALIEVTIAAPADEVWRSLRDKDRVAQWFGWQFEGLEAGIEHIFFKNPKKVDDAARAIDFGRGDRIEVEARGAGSVLRIVRPAPTADHDWEDIFEDETQGWITFILQLRFAVERHLGDTRRTLDLSGAPKTPGGPLAGKALGMPASAPGSSYAVSAPMKLAGTVWHRGRHQSAYTVDGIGDGLIVIQDRAPDAKKPNGNSQVILTTYGMSDAAFDELAATWRAWWDEHFERSKPH